MKKFSDLREKKLKATDYDANIVKSKSGGWLPKITAKGNNDVLYLGTSAFKSKKIAKDAADAYLIGYALGGKKSGEKMVAGHIKNNKKNLVDPSILDFIESVDKSTPIYKEYMQLKKMSIKDLRKTLEQSSRGPIDTKGLDKEGLISDILHGRHGRKRVQQTFGEETELSEA